MKEAAKSHAGHKGAGLMLYPIFRSRFGSAKKINIRTRSIRNEQFSHSCSVAVSAGSNGSEAERVEKDQARQMDAWNDASGYSYFYSF